MFGEEYDFGTENVKENCSVNNKMNAYGEADTPKMRGNGYSKGNERQCLGYCMVDI